MSLDETIRLLTNEERREIIYVLKESEGDLFYFNELIEELVERDFIPDEEEKRARFEVQMGHIHLPKMKENGLIEYDDRSERVRYFGDETVEELLEVTEKYEESSL